MAAGVEDRRIRRMRREAHEVLDRRQPRRRAVRRNGVQPVVRREIEARRIGRIDRDAVEMRAFSERLNLVLASECERVARKAPAASRTRAIGTR
jgi:hypothetical protein